ncbi:hypothetical protein [Muricoccus radiodurans]|uniref:hypothetical protein n=1 Tax=Muricoccus radiodurans TaxID=2231721 RepID=UPI003CF9A4C0
MTSITATLPESTSRGTYIGRHWRGELSLGTAYWVNGVLVTLSCLALGEVLGAYLIGHAAGMSMGSIRSTLIGVIIFPAALTVWQLTGIWRSASLHTSRGGKKSWAVIVQINVGIAVVRNVLDLFKTVDELRAFF